MTHYVLDARTATPHFPGIGRYVTNLVNALIPQLNQDERLTVFYDPASPPSFPDGRAVTAIPVAVSPFSVKQQWVIPQLLRRLDADLYHSAYYLMAYYPGLPTLLTVYDLIPMLFPQHSTFQARFFFRWATMLALHTARHSLAISESTRQDVLKYFRISPECITSIPLAADPLFYPQSEVAINAVQKLYGLPEKFILYLGSNKPHKNLVTLVEAYAHLPSGFPPLVIAGVWLPEYPEARQRAEALGLDNRQVRWLGTIPHTDLPALYAAATLFVFPSLYEGFGLPPLEAMACGVPVACSQVASLVEVGGEAVAYFAPTDSKSISHALYQMIGAEVLQSDLRQRALARAAQFSWQRTAAETLTLYRNL